MRKKSQFTVVALIQVVILALLISPALAQGRGKVRVVVEKFMGRKANTVRRYAINALKKRKEVEIVPNKDVVKALTRLGVTLETENGYVALSRELRVNAFLDGEVTRDAKGWTASLWVRQGDGKFIGQYNWENKKRIRLAMIRKTLWGKLGDAILSAQIGEPESVAQPQETVQESGRKHIADEEKPPTFQQVEQPEKPEDPAEARPEADKDRLLPSALHARLFFGTNWRNNSYEPDDTQQQPFRYFNEFFEAAPWLGIYAKWFPAAHDSDEWFAHIGLAADFRIGLGASSEYEDPETEAKVEPSTTSFAFSAGLFGRIPLDPVELGLTLAYGQRVFETSGFDGLPDVAHGFLRMGASGDVTIAGGLGVDLAIAYLLRLDSGELASEDYFPELSGGGVEAGIGVYYKIIDWLSVRADWSMQYFYFDTGASDAFEGVTGGDDGYYTATIGVAYDLDGER